MSPWLKFWGAFSFLGGQKFVHLSADPKGFVFLTRLLIGLGKKSQISRDFWGQICGKIGANFTEKQSVKKTADFVVIFRANFARNQSVLR